MNYNPEGFFHGYGAALPEKGQTFMFIRVTGFYDNYAKWQIFNVV